MCPEKGGGVTSDSIDAPAFWRYGGAPGTRPACEINAKLGAGGDGATFIEL